MIVLCEPVCWGWEHVPINSALVEIVCRAFPSTEIVFYGEASHIAHLQSELHTTVAGAIVWKPVTLPGRRAPFRRRWFHDVALAVRLLNRLGDESEGLLLLCGATPVMVLAVKVLMRLQPRRRKRVQIVCHGWLSSLRGWRSRNPFIRLVGWRSALTRGNDPCIQFVVLEEPIRDAVAAEFPDLAPYLAVLHHPIPSGAPSGPNVEMHAPFRFGFLGLASDAKGFPAFLEMASTLRKQLSDRVEFHAIGTLPPGSIAPPMEALTIKAARDKSSRADFSLAIQQLHYVCLPYDGSHYELSASGVLMDAIAFGKPVLAAGIPLVRDLFDQFGDIGFLCTDTRAFCATIVDIVTRADAAHYRAQVHALRAIRDSRTPEALASAYAQIVGRDCASRIEIRPRV